MRWVPWVLGLAGVAQHALMALLEPDGYVSLDMSYLVMWLSLIGALLVCYSSCGCDGCGWSGDGDCSCCGDHCHCGDCPRCSEEHDHGPANGAHHH